MIFSTSHRYRAIVLQVGDITAGDNCAETDAWAVGIEIGGTIKYVGYPHNRMPMLAAHLEGAFPFDTEAKARKYAGSASVRKYVWGKRTVVHIGRTLAAMGATNVPNP